MKVLIGAPLKQKPHIFKEHLKSLHNLIIPEGVEVDFFWVVNDCPEVIPMLKENEYCVKNYGWEYKCDEEEHHWDLVGTSHMSELRDILLRKALYEGYDYYFSVDTDLILQPETLQHLLSRRTPLVAEVFWTKGKDGNYWSNAWEFDQCQSFPEDIEEWKKPGLYVVGGTGACFLIHRSVLEKGVKYQRIPCIVKALLGEDRHFCIRAICNGFNIYLDTCYPAIHLYRESEYEAYMKGLENADNS